MPAYRFELARDSAHDTVQGIELASIDDALEEARQAARDAMMDALIEGIDTSKWGVRVYDEAGFLVVNLRFAELLHKEGQPPNAGQR